MSRRAAVTEAEIKRAIRAVTALGLVVAVVRISDGKVEVVIGEEQSPDLAFASESEPNEWDEVLQ